MAGFSGLNGDTIRALTGLVDEGAIFTSQDLSDWKGTHMLHVQPLPQVETWTSEFDAWVIDKGLPRTLNYVQSDSQSATSRVCKVTVRIATLPGWELAECFDFACMATLTVEAGIRIAEIRDPTTVWICAHQTPDNFLSGLCICVLERTMDGIRLAMHLTDWRTCPTVIGPSQSSWIRPHVNMLQRI